MDKNIKYEDAIKELEDIVNKLENPETGIDKAFELYEKGIELSKFCEDYLDKKEQKLKSE